MKAYIKSLVALTVICAVMATLLAVTNYITAPVIEENEKAATNAALLEVLPDGKDFALVDLSAYELPATVTEAYTEANGGCVVKLNATGLNPGMIIMCGINKDGEITGAVCLSSAETYGAEKTYGDTAKGFTADSIDGLDVVAGSTKTTQGYKDALRDALNTAIIIGGGSVDIRTEEEILADNLSAALPSAEGKFTKWFVTEALTDVSAVYVADNGMGYVLVSGESFIAVDADGNVISEVADDVKSVMSANVDMIKSSKLNEIDITGYEDMPKAIDKAHKTESGNYVFELHASGFGKKGESYGNPSGEYIYIKISMTADGTILACETVSQEESEGYGDACAKPDFYAQFDGKDEATYTEIDGINGATITTDGYIKGVKRAFEALAILEGRA